MFANIREFLNGSKPTNIESKFDVLDGSIENVDERIASYIDGVMAVVAQIPPKDAVNLSIGKLETILSETEQCNLMVQALKHRIALQGTDSLKWENSKSYVSWHDLVGYQDHYGRRLERRDRIDNRKSRNWTVVFTGILAIGAILSPLFVILKDKAPPVVTVENQAPIVNLPPLQPVIKVDGAEISNKSVKSAGNRSKKKTGKVPSTRSK